MSGTLMTQSKVELRRHRYEPLSLVTRKQVWVNFLKKAVTLNGAAEFDPKGA